MSGDLKEEGHRLWISGEDGPEMQTPSESRGPRKGQGHSWLLQQGCEERAPGTEGVRKGTDFMGLHAQMLRLLCDLVTPWTAARQAPLSMGFFRQEYWSELPRPPPGDLSNPGLKPRFPEMQADSLLSEPRVKLCFCMLTLIYWDRHNPETQLVRCYNM